MKLTGQRIVITGGTSGIGHEIVKQLITDNELIVISSSTQNINALKKEFKHVIAYEADLSNLKEIEAVSDCIVKHYDSIDILINNAASQYTPTFLDENFCYERIATEIALNFTSVCCLSYSLLPLLLHEKESTILNINSGLGLTPKTSSAVYCGTKGAMNLFSQSLGYQLETTNVSVQQAFLPLVETPMTTGRGKNKMSAEKAAGLIIQGLKENQLINDIGKVKLLRKLLRVAPSLAKRLLKNS